MTHVHTPGSWKAASMPSSAMRVLLADCGSSSRQHNHTLLLTLIILQYNTLQTGACLGGGAQKGPVDGLSPALSRDVGQQGVQQAFAYAGQPQHQIPPQVQAQLVHRGLVLVLHVHAVHVLRQPLRLRACCWGLLRRWTTGAATEQVRMWAGLELDVCDATGMDTCSSSAAAFISMFAAACSSAPVVQAVCEASKDRRS